MSAELFGDSMEKEVIPEDAEGQKFFTNVRKERDMARASCVRAFTFLFEGVDYIRVHKMLKAIQLKGENNTDTFKRLLEKEYKA